MNPVFRHTDGLLRFVMEGIKLPKKFVTDTELH